MVSKCVYFLQPYLFCHVAFYAENCLRRQENLYCISEKSNMNVGDKALISQCWKTGDEDGRTTTSSTGKVRLTAFPLINSWI